MFYDPMIAKLITWAPTRLEAIDAQVEALDQFVIDGISDNVDFLSALMQHPRFRSGDLSTGFIAEEYPDGFVGCAGRRATDRGSDRNRRHGRGHHRRARGGDQRPARRAAACAVRADREDRRRSDPPGPDQALQGRNARGDRRRGPDGHRRPLGAGAAAADRSSSTAAAHRPGPPRRPRLGAADARREPPGAGAVAPRRRTFEAHDREAARPTCRGCCWRRCRGF